jgi:hypothetical protein
MTIHIVNLGALLVVQASLHYYGGHRPLKNEYYHPGTRKRTEKPAQSRLPAK